MWSELAHEKFIRRDDLHREFANLIGVESAPDEVSELAHYGIDPVLDAFAMVGPGDKEKFLSALDGHEPKRFFRHLVRRWPEDVCELWGYSPRENLTTEEAEAVTRIEAEIEFMRLRREGFDLRSADWDKKQQHLPFCREVIEAGYARLREERPQEALQFDFAKQVLDELVGDDDVSTW
jgi:hypothetical protein